MMGGGKTGLSMELVGSSMDCEERQRDTVGVCTRHERQRDAVICDGHRLYNRNSTSEPVFTFVAETVGDSDSSICYGAVSVFRGISAYTVCARRLPV